MNVKKILSIFILGLFFISFVNVTIAINENNNEKLIRLKDVINDLNPANIDIDIENYNNADDYATDFQTKYFQEIDKANLRDVEKIEYKFRVTEVIIEYIEKHSNEKKDIKDYVADKLEDNNNLFEYKGNNIYILAENYEEVDVNSDAYKYYLKQYNSDLFKKPENNEEITNADLDDDKWIEGSFDGLEEDYSLVAEDYKTLSESLNKLKSTENCPKLNKEIQDLEHQISVASLNEGKYLDLETQIQIIGKYTSKKDELSQIKEKLDNPTNNLDEYKKLVKSGYHESSTGANIIFEEYIKATDNKKEECTNPSSDDCQNAIKELEKYSNTLKLMTSSNVAYVYQKGFSSNRKEDQEKYISIYTKEQCSDAYFSDLCEMLSFESQATIQKKQILNSISEATKGKTSKDEYNDAIYETLKNNYGIKVENQEDLAKKLEQAQTELDNCQGTEDCNQKRANFEVIKAAYGQTKVKTNVLFSILDAIKNPDKNALKAAKLFGFEADYSNLPSMLGETLPSQICLDKIDGYLDKEVENDGGVTQYNDNVQDLDVLADLRAQRSSITPDNKTQITYSYYVKDPEEPFLLSVKYVQNGDWKSFVIENSSSSKGYDSVAIPLNTTDGIETNSFTINLDTGNVHLTYPIILMSTSALSDTIENTGNSAGNQEAIINENLIG